MNPAMVKLLLMLKALGRAPALAKRGYKGGAASRLAPEGDDMLSAMEAMSGRGGTGFGATARAIGGKMGGRSPMANLTMSPNYAGFAAGRHPKTAMGVGGGVGAAALMALLSGDEEGGGEKFPLAALMDDDFDDQGGKAKLLKYLQGNGFVN